MSKPEQVISGNVSRTILTFSPPTFKSSLEFDVGDRTIGSISSSLREFESGSLCSAVGLGGPRVDKPDAELKPVCTKRSFHTIKAQQNEVGSEPMMDLD